MRRAKLLINEARSSTNNQLQIETLTDILMFQYINRIQSYIQDRIFALGIKNKFNVVPYDLTLTPGVTEYDLPYDIYAANSVNNVFVVYNNATRTKLIPMNQLSEKSVTNEFGYVLRNNKIIIPQFLQNTYGIRILYNRKCPDLGDRLGKVVAKTATTLELDVTPTTVVTDYQDFISTVNINGAISRHDIRVTSQAGDTLTVDDTTDVAIGDYVVLGYYSSTHSELIDPCEKILLTGLEKLIMARLSSVDIEISSAIDGDMLSSTLELVSDNSGDDFGPPVLNWSEWFY